MHKTLHQRDAHVHASHDVITHIQQINYRIAAIRRTYGFLFLLGSSDSSLRRPELNLRSRENLQALIKIYM